MWSYKKKGDKLIIHDGSKQVAECKEEVDAKLIVQKMNDFNDLKESAEFLFMVQNGH